MEKAIDLSFCLSGMSNGILSANPISIRIASQIFIPGRPMGIYKLRLCPLEEKH